VPGCGLVERDSILFRDKYFPLLLLTIPSILIIIGSQSEEGRTGDIKIVDRKYILKQNS
jgi:hypothetical protein